ncbi:MAG: M48 family metallopeptidase, partial [Clostridiales bacterium]|nr:M48 family metallopeptidase [Clostridiales bacterium]
IITINGKLAAYDENAVKFVLMHELCHLRVPNHSAAFYDELKKYCPNWKEIKKTLHADLNNF